LCILSLSALVSYLLDPICKEYTSHGIISECIATLSLLALVTVEYVLQAECIFGNSLSFWTFGLTQQERLESIGVFSIMLVFQIVGIACSHYIIRVKNRWQDMQEALVSGLTAPSADSSVVEGTWASSAASADIVVEGEWDPSAASADSVLDLLVHTLLDLL
jgi:hypothetical protein